MMPDHATLASPTVTPPVPPSSPQKPKAKGHKVSVNGRNFTIYLRTLPAGSALYYLRFEDKGDEHRWSLGTNLLAAAKVKAKEMLIAHFADDTAAVDDLRRRSDYATIGEVIEAYEKIEGEKTKTIAGNVRSLKIILREGLGTADVESLRTSVLTGELVRKWAKLREAMIGQTIKRGGEDSPDPGKVLTAYSARTTIRSTLCQARSIFAPAKVLEYRKLKLPDLKEFRGQAVQGPQRRQPRPVDAQMMAQIDRAAPALGETNPPLYLVHLLFRYLGMRNIEIENARWGWIEKDAEGNARMAIISRPEENGFDPKGNEGRVPISPDVLAELMKHRKPGSTSADFIVPADSKSARINIVYRDHSQWVGQWIEDLPKTSYELRRYGGSAILDATGGDMMAARDFLRHANVTTTLKWYAYRLKAAPCLGLSRPPAPGA